MKYGLKRYSFFKDITPQKGRILDVGSGAGRTIKLVHKLNPELDITALDISRKSLDKLPNYAKTVKASALDIPFKSNYFDFVYSVGCLHHTLDAKRGFQECCRVLKKGGQLAVSIYNKWNTYPLIYNITKHTPKIIKNKIKSGVIQDNLFTPQASFHSFWQVKQWFKENNIKLIKYDSINFYPPWFTKHFGTMIYYYGKKF